MVPNPNDPYPRILPVDWSVEEAHKSPVTFNEFPTEEDAVETKPPSKVASWLTARVEEAEMGPATCSGPAKLEEADEISPL